MSTSERLSEIIKVVDSVNSFFESDGRNHDVDAIHAQFVELIDEANGRLKRCDALLRKGLRGEAIQEAELEPNIFDVVAELDTPAWDAWRDHVVASGLLPQPELLLGVAADINEAYNAHQPLEHLLRRHRVYALARGPLSERISILRSLAKRDSGNTMWADDLKSYEKARVTEIEKEIKQCCEVGDLAAVERLHHEVESGQWVNPPTAALTKKINKSYRSLIAVDAMKNLEILEPKINDAFSAFNFPETQKLKTIWEGHFPKAVGKKKGELGDHVRPAFQWVEERLTEDRDTQLMQKAHAQLEGAIEEDGVDKVELQRLMGACDRFEEPVPERLQRRFDERIRSFELREKRKSVRTLLVIVSSFLVAGVIGWGVLDWRAKQNETTNAKATLTRLLDESKLQQAKTFLAKLDEEKPHVGSSPELAPGRVRLEQLSGGEVKRLASFNRLVQSARDQSLDASEPSRQDLRNALEDLKEAEKIASGDSEELRVVEIKRDIKRIETNLQKQADSKFVEKAKVFKDAVAGTKLNAMPTEEVEQLIANAEALGLTVGVSQEARRGSQLSLIIRKMKDFQKAKLRAGNVKQIMTEFENSVGDRSRYKRAVMACRDDVVRDDLAKDLRTVLENNQLDLLTSIEDWNLLVGKWNRKTSGATPQVDAKNKLPLITEIETKFLSFPGAKDFVDKTKDLLTDTAARNPRANLDSLIQYFQRPDFKVKQIVDISKENAPKVYYLLGEPYRENDDNVWFQYLNDFRSVERTEKVGKPKVKLSSVVVDGTTSYVSESPQKKFSQTAVELLKEKGPFEEKICVLLKQLTKDTRDIDPVLELKIARRLLDEGIAGSRAIEQGLKAYAAIANKDVAGLKTANYFDPTDLRADLVRGNAKTILDGLPDPMEIYETAVKPNIGDAKKFRLFKLHWLGVAVRKNNELQPIYSRGLNRKLSGDVYVQSTADGSLIKVARFQDDSLTWYDRQGVVQGTPLLLSEDSGGKK